MTSAKVAYQEAWLEAKRVNVPMLWWDPLIRAATLAQLGRTTEAQGALVEQLQREPGFTSSRADLMRRKVQKEEYVESLVDGLRRAGLDVSR